jgi:DNA-binding response OmpR family regulator
MQKILIVEDETDSGLALSIRLQSRGFAVLHATTLATAGRIITSQALDLIVLDLNLPDGNGYALLQRLKSCTATSSIPVIILTARDVCGNEERSRYLGAFEFFQKPANNTSLLRSIEWAVSQQSFAKGRKGSNGGRN